MENLEKIKKIKALKNQKKFKIGIIIAVILIVVIGIAITTIYQLDKSHKILGGNMVAVFSNEEKEEQKQKDKAVKTAINKFEELGEDVKKEELEVMKIQRKGELFYYISAKDNTVEVRIEDNKITRVNGVLTENQ